MIGSLQTLGTTDEKENGWFDCEGVSSWFFPSCYGPEESPQTPEDVIVADIDAEMTTKGKIDVPSSGPSSDGGFTVWADGTIQSNATGEVWKPGDKGYKAMAKIVLLTQPALKKYLKLGPDMLMVVAAGAGALALLTIIMALLTRKRG